MLCCFKVSFLIEDLTVELHVRMCVYVLRKYVFMYGCPSVRQNTVSVRIVERRTVYTNSKHNYEWVWTAVDNGLDG
jgi:hypothetical protein